MNSLRRKRVQDALDLILDARLIFRSVQKSEQQSHDKMLECMRETENYARQEEVLADLDAILDAIEEIKEIAEDVIS